jgi:hypothetical protein
MLKYLFAAAVARWSLPRRPRLPNRHRKTDQSPKTSKKQSAQQQNNCAAISDYKRKKT